MKLHRELKKRAELASEGIFVNPKTGEVTFAYDTAVDNTVVAANANTDVQIASSTVQTETIPEAPVSLAMANDNPIPSTIFDPKETVMALMTTIGSDELLSSTTSSTDSSVVVVGDVQSSSFSSYLDQVSQELFSTPDGGQNFVGAFGSDIFANDSSSIASSSFTFDSFQQSDSSWTSSFDSNPIFDTGISGSTTNDSTTYDSTTFDTTNYDTTTNDDNSSSSSSSSSSDSSSSSSSSGD